MSALKLPPGRKFEIVSSAWLLKSLTAACASAAERMSGEPVLLSQAVLGLLRLAQMPELASPFQRHSVIVGTPPVQSNDSSTSEWLAAVPSPWRCGIAWFSGPPGAAAFLSSSTERL